MTIDRAPASIDDDYRRAADGGYASRRPDVRISTRARYIVYDDDLRENNARSKMGDVGDVAEKAARTISVSPVALPDTMTPTHNTSTYGM